MNGDQIAFPMRAITINQQITVKFTRMNPRLVLHKTFKVTEMSKVNNYRPNVA